MKQIFVILLMLPSLLCAKPIDPNMAQQIAQNFINSVAETPNVQLNMPSKQRRMIRQNGSQDIPKYYIFNSENEDGFVIVSADDCATPILGYSTDGSIDLQNLPIQLADLLQNYAEEIQYAVENNLQATDSVKKMWEAYRNAPKVNNTTAVVNALISTSWDQYPRYNDKCPSDPSLSSYGGHPTTGCVATAMAQIMKYWEHPKIGKGNKSYNSQRYGTLSANFANTTYDWPNMPIKLSSTTSSTQNNAVATLMYHCGVAVEMGYNYSGNGSSGAFLYDIGDGSASAEQALKTYFGYASNITGKEWGKSISATTWTNLLKIELNNERPILYAGYAPDNGSGGHAFICDGYDNSDKFHFNWGWGGQANGFFSLTALTPISNNFSERQHAIIGIKPADGSGPAKNYDLYMNTDLDAIKTNGGTSEYSFGNTISFMSKVENNGTGIFNGFFKVAIFTYDGKLIAWSNESYHFSLGVGKVTENMTYTFDGGIPFIPGKYRAYMYYQDDDEDDCKLVKTDVGVFLTEYNNTIFTITSSSDLQPQSSFDIRLGGCITGSNITIDVDVKNTALLTTFYGQIRLCLYDSNGAMAQVISEVDCSGGFSARETKRLTFWGFIDVDPGTYYLALTYKKNSQTSWYYMGCTASNPNPINVIVTAPILTADYCEPNNTQSTATTLDWKCNPEWEDFGTPVQVSLHEESDIDFYKVVFPNSNKYKIDVQLCDKHNQCGWHQTADVQFAYSVGGNVYTDFYKGGKTIIFDGPTTLYFRVKQYGMKGLGYYQLLGEIEETSITSIDNVESPQSHYIKLIQNGQFLILHDGKLFNAQGAEVK